MKKIIRKSCLSFFVFMIMSASFSVPAEAFSIGFNPGIFFQTTTNLVVNKISDFIKYLSIQTDSIMSRLASQNVFTPLDNNAGVSTSTATETVASKLITVATAILPNVKKILPVTPVQTKDQGVSTAGISINASNYAADSTSNFVSSNNDCQEILNYTNVERAKVSLQPLSADETLNTIAGLRADDLFANQYFEHASPDGKSVSDLAVKQGYEYLTIGENLALGNFAGNAGIVSAWMESPGHKANILHGKYTKLGVSVKTGVFNGENVTIAVQVFAEPMSVCPKPNPTTKTLIDSSTATIKQMQAQALLMFNNVNLLKSQLPAKAVVYTQKVQEYNSYAKKVNDAVIALKSMIDFYNIQVGKYNSCINN